MVKLVSWNVNGVRSLPNFRETLLCLNADIICLQETRLSSTSSSLSHYANLPGYTSYFSFCDIRRGYSGVATFVRDGPLTPRDAGEGLAHNAQIIQEGRAVRTDHGRFILFNLYVPATGGDETRINFRLTMLSALESAVKPLIDSGRQVIITGDFNITPTLIDTSDQIPAEHRHTWHNQPSRIALRNLCATNSLIDAFRRIHPKSREYTCWSVQKRGRETNTGVRIDYFLLSDSLGQSDLATASIDDDTSGSDHAPVSIELNHPDYTDNSLTPATPPSFCTKFLPALQRTQSSIINFLTPTRSASTTASPQPNKRTRVESPIYNSVKRPKSAPAPSQPSVLVELSNSSPHLATPSQSPPSSQIPTPSQSQSPVTKKKSGGMKAQWSKIFGPAPRVPMCRHGEVCKLKKVNKSGPNRNRTFWSCRRPGGKKGDMATNCDFFEWAPYSAKKPLPRSVAAYLE